LNYYRKQRQYRKILAVRENTKARDGCNIMSTGLLQFHQALKCTNKEK
jgi:hypothetical protein